MAWGLLLASGVMEAVWATALARSEGLTRPWPALVFLVALALSMAGLAVALRDLPVGVAYAVWVGTGAVGTLLYAATAGGERVGLAQALCVGLIVAGVVGLRLSH